MQRLLRPCGACAIGCRRSSTVDAPTRAGTRAAVPGMGRWAGASGGIPTARRAAAGTRSGISPRTARMSGTARMTARGETARATSVGPQRRNGANEMMRKGLVRAYVACALLDALILGGAVVALVLRIAGGR